ncbi:hypothetical protein ABPG74_009230 [Tetrahymena malaccensis]
MIHHQIEDEYIGEKRETSTSPERSDKKRKDQINGNHHNIYQSSLNNQNGYYSNNSNQKQINSDSYDTIIEQNKRSEFDQVQQNSFESDISKGDNDQLIEDNGDRTTIDVQHLSKQNMYKQEDFYSQDLEANIQKAALAVPYTSQKDQYLSLKDIKLLSFLVFCVNYGFSIEMVFISPFFFKVNTPDILDTVIWLIPPLIEKLLFPVVSVPLKKKTVNMLKYRKLFILLFSALSIIGLLLMGFSRYITANWITLFDNAKTSIMLLGVFGFMFQDIGHDIIIAIINQYQNDCVKEEDQDYCEFQFAFASSAGKIAAFLISSVLAFNIDVWDVQNFMENLTFSYSVGGILMFFGFLYSFQGLRTNQMRISQNHQMESLQPIYSIQNILPSIYEIKNMPPQQKCLVFSHFLMCGNLLLINIYATLWMGVTLQQSNSRYNVDSNKVRDYLFDLGISWGALVLCAAAFLYYISSRFVQQLQTSKSQKQFLFFSNFALNLSFIYTYFTGSFYSSCISLLLWGVAQASFDYIPSKICSHLELHYKISNKVSGELLDLSYFFCQILFWFIMPAIFLLFQEFIDDIQFSLFQGSFFGLIGSILVLFIS